LTSAATSVISAAINTQVSNPTTARAAGVGVAASFHYLVDVHASKRAEQQSAACCERGSWPRGVFRAWSVPREHADARLGLCSTAPRRPVAGRVGSGPQQG